MSQAVPDSVFNAATLLAALAAQRQGIDAEREKVADEYIETMRGFHEAGDLLSLESALLGFKLTYGTGWAKRVKTAGLPDLRSVSTSILGICNDGDGRWQGRFPLGLTSPRPARGTWVVYQLLAGDDLLYIGSTGSFAERLKAHSRTKNFDSWRAAECESEAHCRALEAALIDRCRPPLNRMIPTPKLVLA